MDRILGRVVDEQTGESYHEVHRPPPAHRRPFMKRRKDDTREVASARMAVYTETSEPLLAFYANHVRE
jgi:adenylate kinase family enzyme